MTFALDNIVGAYKDFARSYLFYAEVTQPQFFGAGFGDFRFLVQSTKLPQQTLESVDVNYQGMKYELPTTQTFENFEIMFKADPKQELRAKFLDWMNFIHNPVNNIHVTQAVANGRAAYLGDVTLTQLDGTGFPVMSYTLFNAWPKTVGEITLDYGNKEISTFPVTFSYQFHVSKTLTKTLAGVAGHTVTDIFTR